MIRILACIFTGVFGLAFGSFLNVCVSRWPEDESAIKPRSHCRSCGRTLAWWENLPIVSWLALHGRCHTCKAPIGWRYPLVELAVGALWTYTAWQLFAFAPELGAKQFTFNAVYHLTDAIAQLILLWLLVALAVTDAENLWLPDRLTLPGIGLALALAIARETVEAEMVWHGDFAAWEHLVATAIFTWFFGVIFCSGAVLVVRFVYKILRDHEGIGLGDVKLMAMLGGWLGIKGGFLSLGIGVVIGAGVVMLPRLFWLEHAHGREWWLKKVPLGTFLCIGGIICGLWRTPIIGAYQRWIGF